MTARADSADRAGYWWALAAVAAAAGVTLRFIGLDVQSYWTDESFSVLMSADSWSHLWEVSRTEIHPPLYPALLKLWIQLGGTGPVWTRSLSALFGALSLLVAWLGLRRSGLSTPLRATLVALTAVNGFAITYAQETRPYALLWLASVGLTAAALCWLLGPPAAPLHWFVLWAALASATHLFGAILTGALVLTMMIWRRAESGRLAVAGVIGMAPLLVWLAIGMLTPGFAEGASRWIDAPGVRSVADLLTTTFAVGGLEMLDEGFVWRSPWLLAALLLVLALLAVHRWLAARRRSVPAPDPADGRAAAFLAVASGLLIAGTWAVSQTIHLWTLRNMIVAAPLLAWAIACATASLAAGSRARAMGLLAITVAACLALIPVQRNLALPYKTGFGTVMEYLAKVRSLWAAPRARTPTLSSPRSIRTPGCCPQTCPRPLSTWPGCSETPNSLKRKSSPGR